MLAIAGAILCPTRMPLTSPPGRNWDTDDIDATWMTSDFTPVQSREIIILVIQKSQHSLLAV